jgi:integrase
VGLKTARLRVLFAVYLYCGTRFAEACALQTKDVYSIDGSVRPRFTFMSCNGTTIKQLGFRKKILP